VAARVSGRGCLAACASSGVLLEVPLPT